MGLGFPVKWGEFLATKPARRTFAGDSAHVPPFNEPRGSPESRPPGPGPVGRLRRAGRSNRTVDADRALIQVSPPAEWIEGLSLRFGATMDFPMMSPPVEGRPAGIRTARARRERGSLGRGAGGGQRRTRQPGGAVPRHRGGRPAARTFPASRPPLRRGGGHRPDAGRRGRHPRRDADRALPVTRHGPFPGHNPGRRFAGPAGAEGSGRGRSGRAGLRRSARSRSCGGPRGPGIVGPRPAGDRRPDPGPGLGNLTFPAMVF